MPAPSLTPPVITCPSWCTEPHRDDWTNDDHGQPARLHQCEHGQVGVVAEEHLTDGIFVTDDPGICAEVVGELTVEQVEQLVQDLQAAIATARAILAGKR